MPRRNTTPTTPIAAERAPYTRLSLAAKQALHLDRMREPAVSCPLCEAQTTVADLPRHVESSCSGRREPHPLSEWLAWGEAVALGILEGTLCRWVKSGKVRFRGERDHREYLRRDLVLLVAARRKRLSKGKGFPMGKRV